MPSAKKVWRKFMSHLEAAPPGAPFEVGLTYDAKNGWRVYQRIGDKALMMDPKSSRGLHATYAKMAQRPEWKAIAASMVDTWDAFKTLADEADQKNRDKIVPDGYAAAMPIMGNA